MAIGKLEDETDIAPERVRVRYGDLLLYPEEPDEALLKQASEYLHADEVVSRVVESPCAAACRRWRGTTKGMRVVGPEIT